MKPIIDAEKLLEAVAHWLETEAAHWFAKYVGQQGDERHLAVGNELKEQAVNVRSFQSRLSEFAVEVPDGTAKNTAYALWDQSEIAEASGLPNTATTMCDAATLILSQAGQIEGLRKDAERYLFLRDGPKSPHILFSVSDSALRQFGDVDTALDDAIAYFGLDAASAEGGK